MNHYTISQVQAMGPCQPTYTSGHLTKLFAGRETVTIIDVLDAPIPDKDKVWFACRPGVLTEPQMTEFLERTVTRAVTNHALHCGVPEVERWAKKWLSGEDRSADAAADAYAATYAAVAAAAADAAAGAATAAAADAAAARAADAAADAAAGAATGAAYAAERALQVADLREITT